MQALGDKIGSTIIAQSAGVPTIAWNGDNLTVNYQQDRIPQSVYDAANVCTAEDALACAERIGYPVMIKASEGGGGKGIRKVHRSEDVINLYRQVQAEIPGSPIFVMKMASTARHLEVQLLADQYGEAIALSGRDCSVQRRHQKIIEEGPPIAASPSVFKMMERAAVALAKTVGYANAGTVEYLFMEKTNEFAFLELNPRLQVEHPVTENILGLNLPACQLQVAMGIPLHRIADVRKLYGRHPRGRDTIDFEYSERTVQPRHCIAVRVTAENPEAGFQPTSGNIEELQFSSAIDVWGYFSVNNSGMIHEFADSQFGHVFASGKDRESARRAMVVALKQLQIRGDIRTTIEYIIRMMQSDDFINNRIDTDWLDGRIASHKLISMQETGKFCPPPKLIATCGAALQGYQHLLQRDDEFVKMLRVGQVPPKDTLTPTMDVDLIFENVKYKTKVTQSGPQEVIVQCNGSYQQVAVRKLADGGYLLSVDGKSYVAYSREESGGSLRMILDGNTCMFTPEYDPTKLVSAVAGKLARQLIPNGSHVNAGDPFVEIEVMKMYMPLKALEAGIVTFQMSEGAALSPGDVIATCQLDNPDSVVTAEEFQGSLPLEDVSVSMDCSDHDMNSSAVSDPAHVRLREAVASIMKVLDGYPTSNEEVQEMISTFIACNADENLPLLLVEEAMAVLRGRIDSDLAVKISELNDNYRQSLGSNSTQKYPSAKILALIVGFSQSTTPDKRAAFAALTSDLRTIVETFVYQTEEIVLSSMVKFIEKYIDTEKLFDSMSFTDVVNELRKDFASDLNQVLHHCRSHVNVECKNILILRVLEEIKAYPISQSKKRPELPPGIVLKTENHSRKLKVKLGELAKLAQPVYSHISFAANLLMMDQFSVSLENRRQKFTEAVIAALATGEALGEGERVDHLNKFIDSNLVARDLLIDALHNDHDYQLAVMELYLRKIYQKTHELKSMMSGRTLEPTGVPPPGEDTDFSSWIVYKFITKPVEAIPQNDSIINVGRNVSFTDLLALSRHGVSEAEGGPSAIASGKPFAEEVPPQNRQVGDRTGVLGVIASFDDLQRLFPVALEKVPLDPGNQPANAMHIALLRDPGEHLSDDEISAMVTTYLASQQLELQKRCIRRVSFIVPRSQPMPTIFTYRYSMGYIEDVLFRYIEAPLAFHLDLHRLAKFNISLVDGVQSSTGNIHLYRAYPKDKKGGRRFFARLVSFTSDVRSSDMESLFVEALDQLALVKGREDSEDPLYKKNTSSNHIFINIVSPDTVMKPDVYDGILKKIANKYWYKMLRLAATTVELKLSCRLAPDADPLFIRLVATNPTGFVLKVDKYFEALVDGKTIFKSISRSNKGPWDGLETHFPYEVTANFEEQRANAMAASDTLYVYDWPMLFETATEAQWTEYNKEKHLSEAEIEFNLPNQFFSCKELVLYDNKTKEPFSKGWTAAEAEERGVLVPSDREPGKNDVGMVAWIMNISTPEAPQGRDIVVICNDITHQAGSFGTKEDIVFFKVSINHY